MATVQALANTVFKDTPEIGQLVKSFDFSKARLQSSIQLLNALCLDSFPGQLRGQYEG